MLPADKAARAETLGKIRQVLSSIGEISGERAERLARIEKLFQGDEPPARGSGKAR